MNQEANESELGYSDRVMFQHNFCGNYLESAALRLALIKSLQLRHRHAVHRYINTKQDAEVADILQFVQYESKEPRHLKEFLEK